MYLNVAFSNRKIGVFQGNFSHNELMKEREEEAL